MLTAVSILSTMSTCPHPASVPASRRSTTSSGSVASSLPSVGAASTCHCGSIARDLGVVSSAVYRYVKSRDDLLTLLVVDAYDEVGDHVDAAVRPPPGR